MDKAECLIFGTPEMCVRTGWHLSRQAVSPREFFPLPPLPLHASKSPPSLIAFSANLPRLAPPMKSTMPLAIFFRFLMVMLITALAVPSQGEALVQPSCGITIISHGWQGEGAAGLPPWVDTTTTAIRDRCGNVPSFTLVCSEMIDTNGDPVLDENGVKILVIAERDGHLLDLSDKGGAVIRLDWSRIASLFFVTPAPEHPTPKVADAFYDYLFSNPSNWAPSRNPAEGPINPAEVPIHLIGHSRGGSLVSRMAQRLAENGIIVDQMTTLDPHPVGSDWPVTTYINTLFCDNYFREGQLVIPNGQFVTGAWNKDFRQTLDPYSLNAHSLVHTYYYGTIAVDAFNDGDGGIIWNDWYPGTWDNLGRDTVGYSYSRFGNVDRPTGPNNGINQYLVGAGGTGLRTTLPSTSMRWPNVAFDQRKRVAVAGSATATMAYPGETLTVPYWFISRSSSQRVTFFLDDDTNPYNGRGVELGSVENAASGGIIGSGNFNFVALPAHAGTHYVGACAENIPATIPADFRVRYDYLFSPITIAVNSSLVVSPADPFTASGPVGGPFTPFSTTYTLSNQGNSSISWTATASEPWFDLSSAGGTIPSNSFTTVTATPNSAANSLTLGTHTASITIAGPGEPVVLPVTLTALPINGVQTIVTTNVDVRTIIMSYYPSRQTENKSADSLLSVYNNYDGNTNYQRTYLYFDLSPYVGHTVISDGVLELIAVPTYGVDMVGVTLGTANAPWTFTGITWDNQPSFTSIPGVINPSNGSYGEGSSVVWTIPKSALQSWVDNGYNGLVLSGDFGSRMHFHSSRDGHAPKLKFEVDGVGGENDAIWTNPVGGSWAVGANWLGGTIPFGTGVTADFSILNLATDATVTLDGARTIGGLKFGDTAPSHNWTLNPDNGDLLTLDVTTGSPTITVINQTTTLGAVVAGTRGLTKAGAGTLVLPHDTIYSGSTIVRQGNLILGGTYGVTEFSVLSGAVLEFNVASGGADLATTAFTGSGVIRKTGAGVLYWGTSNTTFGMASGSLIDLQEGWIKGGSHNNEVWTNNKADLNVSSGATFDGVEAAVYVNALMGAGRIHSGYPGAASMITFGVDNGSGTFSGVLANAYAPGNFVKTGTGTQILSGVSTYTGTTNINGGVLLANNISGSATGTSPVTVKTTATLGGTGAVSGAVSVESGGTLAPGESGPGSLSVGSLTLAASSRVAFDLGNWTGGAGSGYDSISASSLEITATAANPVTVVIKPQSMSNFANATRSFVLISSPGGISGFAADKFVVDAAAFEAGDGQWDLQVSGTNLLLVYTIGGTPPSNAKPVISGITTPVRLTDGRIGLGFTATDVENNVMNCYIAFRKSDGATYVGNSDTLKGTIPSGSNTVYFTPEELAGMTGLVSGSYQVRVRVLDAVHHTGETCAGAFSPFFTLVMPNLTPAIGQVGNPVQLADGRVRFGFTATDPENNNMTCNIALRKSDGTTYVNNSDVPKGNISSGANTLEFSLAEIANMTGLVGGSYQVRVRVFDAAHNTSAKCAQAFSSYFTYTAVGSYATWISAAYPGVTDLNITGLTVDPDHDGIPNAVEMVLGGNPATAMDAALMPAATLLTTDLGAGTKEYFVFSYRRNASALTSGLTSIVQSSESLGGLWTHNIPSQNGVVEQTAPNFHGLGIDRVRLCIPRNARPVLFGRLQVTVP